MRLALAQGVAGALLVAGAGAAGHAAGIPSRQLGEPLALVLEPLGPAKALLSSTLWVAVLHEHQSGDPEAVVALSRALLEIHPGVDAVREYLAGQLVVTEAARATDAARHAALVQAGLAMLEEGRQRSSSPRLHAALGRLLYTQRTTDEAFPQVAEAYFGGSLLDVAIEALGHSPEPEDALLRAELLVERGLLALADDDESEARADLGEAEAALSAIAGRTPEDQLRLDALLLPLREALAR